jgi:hypothetical protein
VHFSYVSVSYAENVSTSVCRIQLRHCVTLVTSLCRSNISRIYHYNMSVTSLCRIYAKGTYALKKYKKIFGVGRGDVDREGGGGIRVTLFGYYIYYKWGREIFWGGVFLQH